MTNIDILNFVEFGSFYDTYNPLTTYGKKAKNEYAFFYDINELQQEYEYIRLAIELVARKRVFIEKIEYHLKRIPSLDCLRNSFFDIVDIFEINKFLVNYKGILDILPNNIKSFYGFFFQSLKLLTLLSKGKEDIHGETFCLSEKYSDAIAQTRTEIRDIDAELKSIKEKTLEEIFSKFGYNFSNNEFLVIEEIHSVDLASEYFYKEFYDDKNCIIKPIFPKEYFKLHAKKDELINEEKRFEKEVLSSITKAISEEKDNILKYIKAICRFDIALAKAKIALDYNMTKPSISNIPTNLEIKDGRYLVLVEKCLKLQMAYQPLTASFSNRIVIINGANMGGKTAVLKTIAFLQVLAQMGFYVPAEQFRTSIFNQINFIGDLECNTENPKGLSSFGLEIFAFMKTYSKNDKALYFVDEFARHTNSKEGEALLVSIINGYGKNQNAFVFLSTHFMHLPIHTGVSFYRMKGFEYEKYYKYYYSDKILDLSDRIRLINKFMIYELVSDSCQEEHYDAIKIAEILGLDSEIIADAQNILTTTMKELSL